MVERLLERGKTSGRVDDNEETIRKRFHTFQQATLPVIKHYQQLNKVKQVYKDTILMPDLHVVQDSIVIILLSCIQVDSTRSVDEVYEDVKQIVTELTTQKQN